MKGLRAVLWRDLLMYRGQFMAVTVVVVLGIALFAGVYASFQNLRHSASYSYEQLRFGDAWFSVYQAPASIVNNIRQLNGVESAEGRVVEDVSLKLPFKVKDKVTCRIISMPSPEPQVNRVLILDGSYPRHRWSGLIHEDFYKYYRLAVGDQLRVEVQGREYKIYIAGMVRTAEYLYPMKDQLDMTPSTRNFAILYMPQEQAQDLLGYGNSYNDISIRFKPGVDQQETIKNIEKMLQPYGFLQTIPRKYQPSAMTIEMEMMGLEQMAIMFPFLFLSVAGFTIYILLFRLVNQQKQRIGLFMALGVPPRGIFAHYQGFAFIIGLVGAVLGILLGQLSSVGITAVYADVYNLPFVVHRFSLSTIVIGIAIAWISLGVAAYSAARLASRLPPAQAMRPESPETLKVNYSTHILRLTENLGLVTRMAVRNVIRTRRRSLLTALGMSFAVLLLIVSLSFWDQIDFMITRYFEEIQAYNLKVYFNRPLDEEAIKEIARLPGVSRAEPVLEIPCQYSHQGESIDSLAVALVPGSSLHQLYDKDGRPVPVKEDGIVLTETLKNKLKVEEGDYIVAKPLVLEAQPRSFRVIGFADELVGHGGYLTFHQTWRLLNRGESYSSCMVAVDPAYRLQVKNYLADSPRVLYIQDQVFARGDFKQYMKFFYAFLGFMVSFASVMGIAIVFNTTTINIWERKKELSLLKILGMSNSIIKRIVQVENTSVALLGAAIGFPLGAWVSRAFTQSYSTEIMQLPFVIYPRTFIISLAAVLLMLWASQAIALRNLEHWDLVEVLKEREG